MQFQLSIIIPVEAEKQGTKLLNEALPYKTYYVK